MKPLKLLLLLVCGTAHVMAENIESTKDDLRIFLVPTSDEWHSLASGEFKAGKSWSVVDAPGFILFHLRDGTEFGHAVPTLWVWRRESNHCLAIIDEKLRFAAKFENVRVEFGDMLVFDLSNGKKSRTVRMHLLWRPESRLFFVEHRGVEFVVDN